MKNYLFLALFLTIFSVSEAQTISTVAGGNGAGSAANQLCGPVSVFVDASGNIYVTDDCNGRIQKFPPNSNSTTNGTTVAGGNGGGSNADQLFYPFGLFIDDSGYIYVADEDNHRIQKFPPGSDSTTNGTTIASGLALPSGVFVNDSGYVYVTDDGNSRVLKFPPGSDSTTNGITIAGTTLHAGSAANQLSYPSGVFIDSSGNMYVADQNNNRIQKFPPGSDSTTNGVTVAGGNGHGNAANQLYAPSGVFVDGNGNIYVADVYNYRIQKFPPNSDSTTNGLTVAGGDSGSAANQLIQPYGVWLDSSGNIYVADFGNNRIQKYSQIAGITQVTNLPNITLYPNPNNGCFILETTHSINQPFTIYDMLGKKVGQDIIAADKQVVELKGLAAGNYTLQVAGRVLRFEISQ